MIRKIIATLAAAMCAGAAVGQEPKLNEAERQALIANGKVILDVLKDPSRCGGAPPPRGYACAVMLYRDSSADDHPNRRRDRLPELLTVRVRGVQGLDGPPDQVKVDVLSPIDNCPRDFLALGMQRIRLGMFSTVSSESATMELKTVLGWAENEALPAGAPRHADPKVFKLPVCGARH